MRSILLATLFAVAFPAAAQEAPRLSLPIDCAPACLVQNLPDIDPTPDRADALGGRATYDGHKGTDLRVADFAAMRKGVDVLAVAPGTVVRLRDGEPNGRFVPGRDCGNGVVLDHGGGWTTQYCHLAPGLAMKEGAKVERGATLGRIGMTGRTQFPHVHVTLRKGRTVIDPWTGLPLGEAGGAPLWQDTEVIEKGVTGALASGFAGGAVKGSTIQTGRVAKVTRASPLVFYAQFMNVRRGDRIDVYVEGPDGPYISQQTGPLSKPQATRTVFVGRRSWKPGPYKGAARLYRDGRVVAEIASEGTF